MGNQVMLFDQRCRSGQVPPGHSDDTEVCAQRHLRRITISLQIPLRSRHPSEELLSPITEPIRCGLRRENTSSNEKTLAS